MSALVAIAIILLVLAAALAVLAAARRRDTSQATATGRLSRETLKRDERRRRADVTEESIPALKGREIERAAVIARTGTSVVPAGSTAPTIWVPPDPETYDVTRRQFLNRSIIGLMGLGITIFAVVAFPVFLWPSGSGGFGGVIRLGKLADLIADIQKNKGFLYKPEGRMWLTEYPASAVPKAQVAYKGQACLPGMEQGLVALFQKCVHLGCRVPACYTSQWFECPCHGSQYNRVGEKKGGPAPRGLDRFPLAISPDGTVTADTSSAKIVGGPPIGTNTTGQEAEGPHCV
jgi:cytochrome b6-f complex iron-sulfur subunit